jgi:DNA-3-methyladenine glycosylase
MSDLSSTLVALERSFYDRDTATVARELIGMQLVRETRAGRVRGRIVETEAYLPRDDSACHAARGKTPRNASMFGKPGIAYVYAIHSRWCFNVVTEPRGVPAAVLIRALEPIEGLPVMEKRRGATRMLDLARGPARLCEAFDIDRRLDGWDLTQQQRLWIARAESDVKEPLDIGVTPRIGVTSAQDLLLRFACRENPFVSGPRKWASR